MAAITLSPAAPTITLSGLTSAYGTIGSYYLGAYPGPPDSFETVGAAVFGRPGTNFNITNAGTLLSTGTSSFDAGIVLASAGEVKNTGTIIAPAGIFILGTTAGAYTANTGTIHATEGDGIYDKYDGGILNAGTIIAAHTGIDDFLGFVNNTGTITAGGDGIFQRFGTGENSGIILATSAYYFHSGTYAGSGVVTYGTFTNASTGTITAKGGSGLAGIFYSALYNYGSIKARLGIELGVASSFYNTGRIAATSAGVYEGFNLDPYAHGLSYITNYKGGVINGGSAGIRLHYSSADIYNAGLITGTTAVADIGDIQNLGTIKGGNIGVFLYGGAVTNTGTITGATAINAKIHFTEYDASLTITNQGQITGQTGIRAAGGSLSNIGYIEGRSGAGVELTAAGQVYNGAAPYTITGTIAGATAGILLTHGGTVTNTGIVLSGGGDGVDLSTLSVLYNQSTITHLNHTYTNHIGTITGARYGVSLAGAGYIDNRYATIAGGSAAVYLRGVSASASTAGQYTYLYNDGTLTGGQYGILSRFGTIELADGPTRNDITGQIAVQAVDAYINLGFGYFGGTLAGIVLTQGGTIIGDGGVSSSRGAAITAGAAGATIKTGGYISGQEGAVLAGASYLYNQNGGQLFGATIGAAFEAGGTLVNDGYLGADAGDDAITIAGGGTVVNKNLGIIEGNVIFGTGANRLVLDPGSQIVPGASVNQPTIAPTVDLNGGILELAAGTTAIGTLFAFEEAGAHALTIDASANWSFAAGQTFTAPLTNNGTIRQLGGPGATLAAAITGHGEIAITAGTITLDGPVGPHQKIDFLTPGTGNLALGDPAHFKAAIQNFGLHETIDLTALTLSDVKSLSFSAGILTLTETQGTLTFTFSNPAHFAHETFSAFADGLGTGITLHP